jgi:enoyl-CoA hydratase/carnithine racemase
LQEDRIEVEEQKRGVWACRKTGNFMVVDLQAGADYETAAADLAELCDLVSWDEDTRVVVLIFGGELLGSLAAPVAGLKQPVIAAIRGDAIGPALELALSCDLRIGTENAHFGLSQIRSGCLPGDGGTQRLPRLIGLGKALEMILTGDAIDAREAHRIGLLHRVVAPDALLDTAMEVAAEMALKSPLSLRFTKEAVYSGMDLTLDQGVNLEMDLYLILFSTRDRVEGITAFREKRKPVFDGN